MMHVRMGSSKQPPLKSEPVAISSKKAFRRFRFLLTAYCLLLTAYGCTTITRINPLLLDIDTGEKTETTHKETEIPSNLAGPPAPSDDGYSDYAGVVHIHTRYSHDAHGKFSDVVRVANAQRLDYAILTEHNNLRALRDGKQGWHGKTLVLVGMEISTRGGHYLAFNVNEEIDRNRLSTQEIIDEVKRQGGLGFIAHPYFKNGPWRDWTVHGFNGIEAYNVAHDTLDENKVRLVLWTLTAPAEPFYLSIIDRPYDPLAAWDEMIRRHGQVVGIGSTDAHEFHALGIKFAPYDDLFQLVRTHVLIPEPPLTPEAVYDAYRQGHVYIAIGIIGYAKGFSFMVHDQSQVVGIMGDAVALTPNLRLTTVLPAVANLTLFRDGKVIEAATASRWHVPVSLPGAYRVEAMRHGKPWIFSNPIYIRPAPTMVDSPRGDAQ